jgi:hypothetical protein
MPTWWSKPFTDGTLSESIRNVLSGRDEQRATSRGTREVARQAVCASALDRPYVGIVKAPNWACHRRPRRQARRTCAVGGLALERAALHPTDPGPLVLREGRRVHPPLTRHGPGQDAPHPVQGRRRRWRCGRPPVGRGAGALAAVGRYRRGGSHDRPCPQARREDCGWPRRHLGNRSLRFAGGSDRPSARVMKPLPRERPV